MKHSPIIIVLLFASLLVLFIGCKTIPEGAKAVKPFYVNKYLGKWFEIARFDYRFERNLNNVTANYSKHPDGYIKVDNKGFNYKTSTWEQSSGKAKFAGDTTEAKLKVSFFGPFYADYNVIALDQDYTYALVAGNNLDYLWFLSRTTNMPDSIKQNYLKIAQDLGYATEKLIWVEHTLE